MKKWNVLQELKAKSEKLRIDQIIEILLENRGIKTKAERDDFLSPKLEQVTPESVGIDAKELKETIKRIQKAIEDKEKIVIYGDYDVDGICGTAVLWETLFKIGADVMPYIPHRIDEGYGLSSVGISNVQFQISNIKLIITVDNGIVANEAVEFANSNKIDVIITDHHVLPDGKTEELPKAHSIVHTTKLCGTGVAYLLSREISKMESDHLALVALATVADLVPLTGANRVLLKEGLKKLRMSNRVGFLALFKEAGIDQKSIDMYQIGHIIAPRLNAMGRLEYAMESLRLLCTRDRLRAQVLADKLGRTNRERQLLTEETVLHASAQIQNSKFKIQNLLFIAHESYQQGVIGLVAGKLVEEFYRPAIVLSLGEIYSKASARSVPGFNIIEFIRSSSEFLVNAGGHPMAAGFTVETAKIPILQNHFQQLAEKLLDDDKLTRSLRIDCELMFSCIDTSLHSALRKLAPFGMGNPEPTFVSRNVVVEDMRLMGKENKHLKLVLSKDGVKFEAVAFRMADQSSNLKIGEQIDVVFTINENEWNGRKKLQLKVKDIKIN